MKRPIALIIMDGFGLAPKGASNAISLAGTPNIDRLLQTYPSTQLGASGMDVGLPEGQMGNSEVGHMNIGAGRVVYQELTRIGKAIDDGQFYKNPQLLAAVDHCRKTAGALHLMGLVSNGGVHSHIEHLFALLRLAAQSGLQRVYVHAFLDGRDCSPTSGAGFIAQLQRRMAELGTGELATIVGRYYAMDRDSRWERVEVAYNAVVYGDGAVVSNATEAIEERYRDGLTDEFMPPLIVCENGRIESGDSVVFFNFRPDRARELTRAICDRQFDGFVPKGDAVHPHFVCMTRYDETMPNVSVAFAPQNLQNTLGEVVSKAGLRQLRLAETEKYAHVTFFFSGGREETMCGEERVLVPSPKVATYDLRPEMSAEQITERALSAVASGAFDLMVINYANCDMVGHTGSIPAAQRAVETVDRCVGRLAQAIIEQGGVALITADHGNADEMLDEFGEVKTSHTTNPVPLIVTEFGHNISAGGVLADLAPTILYLLGLPKPDEMTGENLLNKVQN